MARITAKQFKAADKNCKYRKYVGADPYTKDEIEFYVALRDHLEYEIENSRAGWLDKRFRWRMSEEWLKDVQRAHPEQAGIIIGNLRGYWIDLSDEYGIPELVEITTPEQELEE
jgi:hypothetical protein